MANGQLTNANQTYKSDLYHALKGGTSNFAVVTRYDLATFPQGNISVTILTNAIQERQPVFDAFTAIANVTNFDVYTSLSVALYFLSPSKSWMIANEVVYTKPVLHPPVYDQLMSIPSISSTSEITRLPLYANVAETPQQ